jgi:peptide methionine sulfoxide reductase MsrA
LICVDMNAVWYHTDKQQEISENSLPSSAKTFVGPATFFYQAEDYHQNYLRKHGY